MGIRATMFAEPNLQHPPFHPGQWVRLKGDAQRTGIREDVMSRPGGHLPVVQTPTSIVRWPLDQIEPVPDAREEPLAFLRAGRFSEPARLRQVLTHIRLTGRLADMIYSMEASNTDVHAHQFKPVLKMLASPTGSLLIADEVGLGKTIDAGLIWTELRVRFDFRRLLVVCPKVLTRKWEDELSGKFGLDARAFSAADLLDAVRDSDRWQRGFVAVCSLQGLKPPRGWDEEGSPGYGPARAELARLLRERADDEPIFDMVVIDEAHHLRNAEMQSNTLARLLRPTTQHQVFLSATPIHLGNDDLFSLPSLIDPETYRHPTVLDAIIEANRPIVEAREAALRGAPLAELRERIEAASRHPLLIGTQKIAAVLTSLDACRDPLPRADRARLADELDTVNLLANTVTRTRRRDVQELRVVRQVRALRAKMAPIEREAYDTITRAVHRYASHTDMPAGFLLARNPMRVEQRIGRVDRLGQAAESVTILNLLHRDTIDDEIYRRLYERLNVCEQALGGFEDVLGEGDRQAHAGAPPRRPHTRTGGAADRSDEPGHCEQDADRARARRGSGGVDRAW
ncbi:DEAD/DEAH box helicase family protein [Elioraea tepida]|uniref:DEAD/DEAH box helicase family protein n=1 Tax=Elioraea tepida TaxID=2843330 RepID=A0A975YKU3_9PROT|nr:SNF2-related protein [Elioraea tepida]QXM26125.1 DEAD/DEAH box helicase family protein [Elioraea tepida]